MPEKHTDDLELRSDEVHEILVKVPNWMIRWGNLLFLILILLVLLISWFIQYPDIIESEVTITTEAPPQKEYAQISGKIQAIFVQDNQLVEKNMPLAVLENTANSEDVFKLKSIIDSIAINGKSFYFPFERLPNPFLGEIETEYALFENSYIRYTLNKEYKPLSNESAANLYTVSEISRQLETLKSQRNIKKRELELAKSTLDRQKSLFDDGAVSVQSYENEELKFAQAELNYQNYETSVSRMSESLSSARKTLKGTEFNRINEETALFREVLQSFNRLKKSVLDWERSFVLKSDIDGRVSFLNYWNTNQTVNQGDMVFTIIPIRHSEYIAKLKTPARNSGKIKLGQRVNIKLENYSEVEFGVLTGQVDHISQIPDEDGFYRIDVKLPGKLVTSYNMEVDFRQEMRGSAEIITEDLRLIERTLFQVMDIFRN